MLSQILRTRIGTLRLKWGKLYRVCIQIEKQRSPAVGKVNNSSPATIMCCAYLTNDPTVRTRGNHGISVLATGSSGADSLVCSGPSSQSLSSNPSPGLGNSALGPSHHITTHLSAQKSGTGKTISLTSIDFLQEPSTSNARDVDRP
jgi:hypothetical protein